MSPPCDDALILVSGSIAGADLSLVSAFLSWAAADLISLKTAGALLMPTVTPTSITGALLSTVSVFFNLAPPVTIELASALSMMNAAARMATA
eukprot:CAMPEP_0119065188 /NCGR_PEP_ID=MMETSP1178-20130426/8063_1 /TAXON_ID=33656 /ORGANISM="unid sp, Strain CCMP2000" /LENGTH=92 /DNA_ID=CAMNT_0007046685 /DNA_START=266 /DNA_END=544 /DNA_ORIENTATION=+